MNKILKVKLSLISLFFIIALFYHEEHFLKSTDAIYSFGYIPFMAVSICFGVVISAAVYNLALFIYIKSLGHLYYALAQLTTLFFLINLDSIFIAPFDEIFGLKNPFLFEVSQVFMLFFSVLFLKEFLHTYKIVKLTRIINTILYLAIFDFFLALVFGHTVLTKFIPIFIPIWLILSEARRLLKDKDMPFRFLVYGWYLVLLTVALEYIGFIDFTGIVFPFLHISFALESLILSLAIAYKFKLMDDEKRTQQTMLLQQSRLASMGEMVSIIAHQWRQPLNFLSFALMHIKKRSQKDDKIIQTIKEANNQLQYMSKTIDNFRNFYNPSKEKTHFDVKETCQEAINIASPSLDVSNIKLTLQSEENFTIFGNQNEFLQVIVNIIHNARDTQIERKIKEPKIEIVIKQKSIIIRDNAGGILPKNIKKVFEPYFSTKSDRDGIGLYIAKTIIEKEMKCRLSVENIENGVEFKITI